jgi:hypothetical protein
MRGGGGSSGLLHRRKVATSVLLNLRASSSAVCPACIIGQCAVEGRKTAMLLEGRNSKGGHITRRQGRAGEGLTSPTLFLAATSAPASTRALTMSSRPENDARCKAVSP